MWSNFTDFQDTLETCIGRRIKEIEEIFSIFTGLSKNIFTFSEIRNVLLKDKGLEKFIRFGLGCGFPFKLSPLCYSACIVTIKVGIFVRGFLGLVGRVVWYLV